MSNNTLLFLYPTLGLDDLELHRADFHVLDFAGRISGVILEFAMWSDWSATPVPICDYKWPGVMLGQYVGTEVRNGNR